MSSVIRTTATKKELPVKLSGVSGPWYEDNIAGYQLFPFFVSRSGELDLNIDYDDFGTNFNNGDEPESTSTSGFSPIWLLGGQQLVTSLGANFTQYIRNWLTNNSPSTGSIDGGTTGSSPIRIFINPVMTKVQLVPQNQISTSDAAFTASDYPPSGDNYTSGSPMDTYKTSWIFKTPLTFTYQSSGVTKYITMYSLLQTDYA